MKDNITIFGGTFNPLHKEHIRIIDNLIERDDVSKVIVMPNKIPPHKDDFGIISSDKRLEMLNLQFKDNENIIVSDFEIKKGGVSYTVDTLRELKKRYPNIHINYCIGKDSLRDIHLWKEPHEIAKLCTLLVFDREGIPCDIDQEIENARKKYNADIRKCSYVGQNISSLKIFVFMEMGIDVSQFVTDDIFNFIKENNLYSSYIDLTTKVKEHLTEKRYMHTAYVVIEALKLARKYKEDYKKAFLAALLHDVGKYKDLEYGVSLGLDRTFLESVKKPVLHQYISSIMAEKLFNIHDEDILNAIKYHSTAREDMSKLEKIIYVADYIEESRRFSGVDKAREKVYYDFETGFLYCLTKNNEFLLSSGEDIDLKSIAAQKYYENIK